MKKLIIVALIAMGASACSPNLMRSSSRNNTTVKSVKKSQKQVEKEQKASLKLQKQIEKEQAKSKR